MAEFPMPQSLDLTQPKESITEASYSTEGNVSSTSFSAPFSFQDTTASPTEHRQDILGSASASQVASRASRHTRSATSLNKLPAFSFNPGASANPGDGQSTSRPSSASAVAPPESPSKGRHRRTTSELVGGHIAVKHPSLSPIKVENIGTDDRQLKTFGDTVAQQGHRHLRSHSKLPSDVSFSLPQARSDQVNKEVSPYQNEDSALPSGEEQILINAQAGGPDLSTSPSPLKRKPRVEFGKSFLVEPRPLSETSDESGSSLSTLKDAPVLGSASSDLPHKFSARLGDKGKEFRSDWEIADPDISALAYEKDEDLATESHIRNESPDRDAILLDVNFDEDPTSAIVDDEVSQHSVAAPDMKAFPHSNFVVPESASDSGVIDLDQAVEGLASGQEYNSMQVRSFQNARRSMHSSGIMSGFMGPGMHYHRRAESAPLLAPFTYERRFDGSASVKGYGMEDVFEEEEEETTPGTPETGKNSDSSPRDQGDGNLTMETSRKGGLSSPKEHMPQSNVVAESVSLLPDETTGQKSNLRHQLSSEDQQLTLPHAPFMTPDTPSSRSFSSRPGQGSSDQSLAFDQSADDVPSLVSGASTWASAPPQSPVPGSSSASTSTLARTEQQRAKRSSLVSLSRLMGGSNSEERRMSSPECCKRSQSTEVLGRRKKITQPRLSKLFKFWKGKHMGTG